MDFSWTEEQLKYKQAVIEFARKELNEVLTEHDRQDELPRANWQKCAQFGILGLATPEAYGGSESDILTTMLVMGGLGYGCRDNGLIFDTNAQKQKYLPGLYNGTIIGAHGMSEPDSGSDAYSCELGLKRLRTVTCSTGPRCW